MQRANSRARLVAVEGYRTPFVILRVMFAFVCKTDELSNLVHPTDSRVSGRPIIGPANHWPDRLIIGGQYAEKLAIGLKNRPIIGNG